MCAAWTQPRNGDIISHSFSVVNSFFEFIFDFFIFLIFTAKAFPGYGYPGKAFENLL